VFRVFLRKQIPTLSSTLDNLEISVEYLSTKWFLTVFIHTLPLSIALRVWDILFALSDEGDNGCCVVLACGIAILEEVKDAILHPEFESTCGNVVETISSFSLREGPGSDDNNAEFYKLYLNNNSSSCSEGTGKGKLFFDSFLSHLEAFTPRLLMEMKRSVLCDARQAQFEQFVSGLRSLRLYDDLVTEKLIDHFRGVVLSPRATATGDMIEEVSFSEEAILNLSRTALNDEPPRLGQTETNNTSHDAATLEIFVWRRDDFSSLPHGPSEMDLQSTEYRVVNHEIHSIEDKSVVMYLLKVRSISKNGTFKEWVLRKRWNDFRDLHAQLSSKELQVDNLPSLSISSDLFGMGNLFGTIHGSDTFIQARVGQLNSFLSGLTGGSQDHNKSQRAPSTDIVRQTSSSLDDDFVFCEVDSKDAQEGASLQERHSSDMNTGSFPTPEIEKVHVRKIRTKRRTCSLIQVDSIFQTRPLRSFLTSDTVDVVEVYNSADGSHCLHAYKAKY
jgi:hypothetical protein